MFNKAQQWKLNSNIPNEAIITDFKVVLALFAQSGEAVTEKERKQTTFTELQLVEIVKKQLPRLLDGEMATIIGNSKTLPQTLIELETIINEADKIVRSKELWKSNNIAGTMSGNFDPTNIGMANNLSLQDFPELSDPNNSKYNTKNI